MNGEGWFTDSWGTATINIPRKTKVFRWGSGSGFTWVEVDDIIYYSCYYSPNHQIQRFETDLAILTQNIRARELPTIVDGDFKR